MLPPARTFNDVEPLSLSTVSKTSRRHTYGSIDRVTGDVYATNTMKGTKTGKAVYSTDFTLKCRPAQRMFSGAGTGARAVRREAKSGSRGDAIATAHKRIDGWMRRQRERRARPA